MCENVCIDEVRGSWGHGLGDGGDVLLLFDVGVGVCIGARNGAGVGVGAVIGAGAGGGGGAVDREVAKVGGGIPMVAELVGGRVVVDTAAGAGVGIGTCCGWTGNEKVFRPGDELESSTQVVYIYMYIYIYIN